MKASLPTVYRYRRLTKTMFFLFSLLLITSWHRILENFVLIKRAPSLESERGPKRASHNSTVSMRLDDASPEHRISATLRPTPERPLLTWRIFGNGFNIHKKVRINLMAHHQIGPIRRLVTQVVSWISQLSADLYGRQRARFYAGGTTTGSRPSIVDPSTCMCTKEWFVWREDPANRGILFLEWPVRMETFGKGHKIKKKNGCLS